METPNTLIFITEKSWVEQKAKDQFHHVASLAGVVRAVAFPDLHPGRGIPIGAAIATEEIIYPHLISNDIGCGIDLFRTGIKLKDFKAERLMKKLDTIDSFASIGGGNHFAEFTTDGSSELLLLIHSGSRNLGERIYDEVIRDRQGHLGLRRGTANFNWYMEKHDEALAWARENRRKIAKECLELLGRKSNPEPVCENVHNAIEGYEIDGKTTFVHRKGAAQADKGLLVIPGSRGSLSYIVTPIEPSFRNLFSLAHGAGRKLARSRARENLSGPGQKEKLAKTKLGSWVYYRDKELIVEEAPEAYKNIERVIADLEAHGLISIAGRLKPLLTIKF